MQYRFAVTFGTHSTSFYLLNNLHTRRGSKMWKHIKCLTMKSCHFLYSWYTKKLDMTSCTFCIIYNIFILFLFFSLSPLKFYSTSRCFFASLCISLYFSHPVFLCLSISPPLFCISFYLASSLFLAYNYYTQTHTHTHTSPAWLTVCGGS